MQRILGVLQGFRHPTLSRKLAMLAGLALLGVLLVAGAALWNMNRQLLASAQERTRAVVDAAYGIVAAYEAEERAGRLPREEAQRRALAALNVMRYGEGDYVFVVNPDYTTVGHPSAQMIGRSMRDARDPTGRYFAREIVDTATRNGTAVTRYQFPKAGSDVPVDKVSFARYFAAWTWTIGSGVYLDDVAVTMRGELMQLGVVALAWPRTVWSYTVVRFVQVLCVAPIFPLVVGRIAQQAGGGAIGIVNSARIGASFLGPIVATSVLASGSPTTLYVILAALGVASVPLALRRLPRTTPE